MKRIGSKVVTVSRCTFVLFVRSNGHDWMVLA
jgi:hypothetical protein